MGVVLEYNVLVPCVMPKIINSLELWWCAANWDNEQYKYISNGQNKDNMVAQMS